MTYDDRPPGLIEDAPVRMAHEAWMQDRIRDVASEAWLPILLLLLIIFLSSLNPASFSDIRR